MNKHVLSGLICLLVVASAALVFADGVTAYVKTAADGGDDSAAGDNWATAYATISNALAHVGYNDTVIVSNGTYNTSARIFITNGVTVRSADMNWATTLVAANASSNDARNVFVISHSNAVLAGFTIKGGYSYITNATPAENEYGGGIYMSAGTVTNCNITQNSAARLNGDSSHPSKGGGVYMAGGMLIDSIIHCNSNNVLYCDRGGGVYMTGGTVQNCVISNNFLKTSPSQSYAYGGAAYMEGGTMKDCTIPRNYGYYCGGIMGAGSAIIDHCTISDQLKHPLWISGDVVVMNCIIENNSDSILISSINSVLKNCVIRGNANNVNIQRGKLLNCLIVGNQYTGNGGGVWFNRSDDSVMENCTIVGNRSGGNGGGVAMNTSGATVSVKNCIIVGNDAGGSGSNLYDTINITYSCCAELTNGVDHNVASAPLLVDAGSNYGENHIYGDYRLTVLSPCINSGTNDLSWMTGAVDLDGDTRLSGGTVDMGAYELLPPRGTVVLIN